MNKSFKILKIPFLLLAIFIFYFMIFDLYNTHTAYAATVAKLNKVKITLYVGDASYIFSDTYQLKVKNANGKKTKWSTKNKDVAIVSKNGKVTAKNVGNTIITAKINKKVLQCKVFVKNKNINRVFFDKAELTMRSGEQASNGINTSPNKAILYYNIKWDTSDKNVAYIYHGVVYAVSPGVAVITAQIGDKTGYCRVIVEEGTGADNNFENQNGKFSAFDKLYEAIMNSSNVNATGNHFIVYTEYNGAGDECTAGIVYNQQSNQFDFICSIEDQDDDEITVISASMDRNGSKTISVNCSSVFDFGGKKQFFDMTGYLKITDYTEYTELNFTVNDSKADNLYFCKKQANVYVQLFLLYCDMCLLKNNVDITIKDIGFINFY